MELQLLASAAPDVKGSKSLKKREKGCSSIVLELRSERHFSRKRSTVVLSSCRVLTAWRTTRKNGRGSRVRKVPANRSESSKPHNLPLRAQVSQKTSPVPCFPVNYSKTSDSGQAPSRRFSPNPSYRPSRTARKLAKKTRSRDTKASRIDQTLSFEESLFKSPRIDDMTKKWKENDYESGDSRKVASNDVSALSQGEAFVRLCIDYDIRAC